MAVKNAKIRTFIIKAFLRINQDDPEILAVFQNQLYDLGQIILQRQPDLYEEIIKLYTNESSSEKIKVELNRAKRIRN